MTGEEYWSTEKGKLNIGGGRGQWNKSGGKSKAVVIIKSTSLFQRMSGGKKDPAIQTKTGKRRKKNGKGRDERDGGTKRKHKVCNIRGAKFFQMRGQPVGATGAGERKKKKRKTYRVGLFKDTKIVRNQIRILYKNQEET